MSEPSQFVRVSRIAAYYSKKTTKKYTKGRRVSAAYAKRYPHLVRQVQFLQIEQRQQKFDPKTKKQTYGKWVISSRQRLNYYEQILDVKKFSERSVRQTLARQRVFSQIWENSQGSIRVTVNGHVDGRRVKEVIHIGYLKRLWEGKHNGYSKFKDDLVNQILRALRKRGLRLSNPKESLRRLRDLHKRLMIESDNLSKTPDWMQHKILSNIKAISKSIRLQKRSRQLLGGTIRIEKLVP